MMTKTFFGRGTSLLRAAAAAAAAALILMEGASAQEIGQDVWEAHITSCSDFVTNDVDSHGIVNLDRPIKCEIPKVVHIMANSVVQVRSNDVLAASNLHFVVHDNAVLVLSAKNAIMLDRHESSTQPLFTIYGKVFLHSRTWAASSSGFVRSSIISSSSEAGGGIVRTGEMGMLISKNDARYSPNAITVVANEAATPGKGSTADPPGHNEAPGGPEPETSEPKDDDEEEQEEEEDQEEQEEEEDLSNGKLPPPLKLGDVLRGELESESGNSATWAAGDGRMMIGQGQAGSTPAPDNSHSSGSVSEWSNVATLLEPNHGKVRAALGRREEVKREKEAEGQGEGVSQGRGERKTKTKAFFGWRRRVEREELERARENFEEVDVTIDDRACLKVTIDGTPVLERSGKFRWEFLNRFPWRRPRDDGYEVHVADSGIDVQLRGKTVWGVHLPVT